MTTINIGEVAARAAPVDPMALLEAASDPKKTKERLGQMQAAQNDLNAAVETLRKIWAENDALLAEIQKTSTELTERELDVAEKERDLETKAGDLATDRDDFEREKAAWEENRAAELEDIERREKRIEGAEAEIVSEKRELSRKTAKVAAQIEALTNIEAALKAGMKALVDTR